MPVVAPVPMAPYDTVETALQVARVRLNDAIESIHGDVITDTQPFTQVGTNAAWRRIQEFLANAGCTRFHQETVLFNIPACGNADLVAQVWLNWTQYFDGSNYFSPPNTPVLPQNFISPLSLQERISGTTGQFTPIDQVLKGLPRISRVPINRLWEWRDETIYMPGATGATDIIVRYLGFLPDFVQTGSTDWTAQPIPIMRCLDPLSWAICAEFARARGDLDAAYFDQAAQASALMILDRDTAYPSELFKQTERGKMPDRFTPAGPAQLKNPAGAK